MNIAVIFAGGSGKRMNAKDKPKQFLLIHGKPIIVHTIELFQEHEEIDGIVVACIEDWIPYMEEMKYRYRLDKIGGIVPGGSTGQLSIYNGLKRAAEIYGKENNVVLIHDGVRPLINHDIISENIASVKKYGSAITCNYANETVILTENAGMNVKSIPNRSDSRIAKAPQSFWLNEILDEEEKSIARGDINVIDSCTLMIRAGKKLNVVIGPDENIKITTPSDFYIFRALYDERENEQLK